MSLPLVDGKINFRGASLKEAAEKLYAEPAMRVGFRVPPISDIADVPPLPAKVDYGRWCVDCPDCNGAEFVWLDGPLVMMCAGCWNAMVGHKWRPVNLPTPKKRARIDELLRARPLPVNRNWLPSETVADLERENAEHGVGV